MRNEPATEPSTTDPAELRGRHLLLGVTGGVHSAQDVVKCIMAGAKVACMTSALLRNGAQHAGRVVTALNNWLDEHEYASVAEMCGSMSYCAVPDPTTFMRGDSASALRSFDL